MKVIVNFGEKKVVVPCGTDGDISIRELIHLATTKFCKLSYNNNSILNSAQVQLRLNNGAVVDPDDRVCDVVDDREELIAIIDHQTSIYPSRTNTMNSNGELSSSITSSNLSSSLSEHERLNHPNQHEVIVTDADLRTRSLRVKNDPNYPSIIHRSTYSPPTQDTKRSSIGMFNIEIDDKTDEKIFSIVLPKENSPLGIHVIPSNDNNEQVNGLILQNIEADGRIQRQGILQINDRIIEINRTNIERCSFDKAQLIFRTALLEPELELRIVRKNSSNHSYQKTRTTLSEINPNHDSTMIDHDLNMHSLNTRRLGKIIKISLIKGHDGLGFKLASRDNPTGVANPIYVKTIFPKGAAIEDGRLQRGDRLLMVNSIDITQMSLQETVSLLRDTRVGETVELCISRQRDGSTSQDLIHDGMHMTDHSTSNESKGQIMTFDIPLNDTSSAGLGITLKGKTSIIDGQSIDLGIFIKSILTGGAASRDNRLRPNDQIFVINDSSLINLSNSEAAAILHEAVRHEIHPGHIKVTICRLPSMNDEQNRYVKEIDLSPTIFSHAINNDENELDLTTFVPPPLIRKPPTQHSNRHSSQTRDSETRSSSTVRSNRNPSPAKIEQSNDIGNNPFERETPFRQSVSEKRRLTHQPNKQVIEWKQRSFHESRSETNRKSYPMMTTASIEILTPVIDLSDDDDDDIDQTDIECRYSVTRRSEIPSRTLPDTNNSSFNLVRSSSFESIHTNNETNNNPSVNDEERKRQAKLRSRACNDSFRQAVDKSYGQNIQIDDEENNINEKNKSEKQKFRFTNLFTAKSKRKDNSEDNRTIKSTIIINPTFHPPPPPPPPLTYRQDSTSNNDRSVPSYSYSVSTHEQQQGYQPYRFDSSYDHGPLTRYESSTIPTFQPKTLPNKSSLSIINSKSTHPPIPQEFLQNNLNGSQSLRQHQISSHSTIIPPNTRSPYPSTFTVQPSHFTSYSHNFDHPINSSQQQTQQQQQTRRFGSYSGTSVYPSTRNYFHLESPANV